MNASPWTPPTEIAEFRLERRLGQGATSDVWLARDTLLDRVVALKIARDPASDEARTRFRIEARAIARVQHPNLVAIHSVGEIHDHPYLVTEFLAGQSLDHLALPLTPGKVVALGLDLARALAAAHEAGVLHRDIKPANALLGDDGVGRLLDFGLARLGSAGSAVVPPAASETHATWPTSDRVPSSGATSSTRAISERSPLSWSTPSGFEVTRPDLTSTDRFAGTPLYMAPEIWREESPTRASDVYSLGALLFELLVAAPPISTRDHTELVRRAAIGDVDRLVARSPGAPAPLAALIHGCLALTPGSRPTAQALCDALALLDRPSAPRSEAGTWASPYRGLRTFEGEHGALFFGREAETAAVLAELRASAFVLIVGASGSGKSSLVRAGVLPRLQAETLPAGERSSAALLVPGFRPVEALSRVVAPLLSLDEAAVTSEIERDPAWLADELGARRTRLFLVIDQLEEIWTLCEPPERALFFRVVDALTQSRGGRVVATLRSDFLGRVEDMGDLQTRALRAMIVLRPMTREGLRRAIVEPARLVGVTIEPALVDHLVDRTDSGSLPLLEFALESLDARRHGADVITLSDLHALGGVEGALAAHADAALARLGDAQRRKARAALLHLVTRDKTRSRRQRHELVQEGDDVAADALAALIDARLVVAGAGEVGPTYEIAHEALLTGWPALRGWLDEEAATREAEGRLERAVAEWERAGRPESMLLGARRLAEVESLDLPSGASSAFLQASREHLRRLRRRRSGRLIGVPAAIGVAALTAWGAVRATHSLAVSRAVQRARVLEATASESARAAGELRKRALDLFDQDDLAPANETWTRALASDEEADRLRRDEEAPLDEALALAPRDRAVRAMRADLVLSRLLSAERLHKEGLARELLARLPEFDDGSRMAQLRAPAHVRFVSDPPQAALTLLRYRSDASGRRVESDPESLASGAQRELEAGSYLLVSQAEGRYPTRQPFTVARGDQRTVSLVLPRRIDVPEGMVYVPAGTVTYGSADDEPLRAAFEHQPAHEVAVGAFLIERLEVTNADYLAFADTLPADERKTRLAATMIEGKDGGLRLKFSATTSVAWGAPYCRGDLPCTDWARIPFDAANRDDTAAFLDWLRRSGKLPTARLCTDREWERAARGADDRRYPHGDAEPAPDEACTRASYARDPRIAGPCAAGSHPRSQSPFGVEDMAGSEFELVSGTGDRAKQGALILRGASWANMPSVSQISARTISAGDGAQRFRGYGIRVCADASDPLRAPP